MRHTSYSAKASENSSDTAFSSIDELKETIDCRQIQTFTNKPLLRPFKSPVPDLKQTLEKITVTEANDDGEEFHDFFNKEEEAADVLLSEL